LLQDGEAAYREAHARGYYGDRIVLMGASLGTGVAIALGMTHEVAALVLEAPYFRHWTSPPRVSRFSRSVG
jgi:uncharacterized protein